MIWRWFALVLSVAFLCPVVLHAQAERNQFDPFRPNAADSSPQEKMYEDIEIFRRILDRKLHPLYPRTLVIGDNEYLVRNPFTSTYLSPNEKAFSEGLATTVVIFPSLEGVYLKDQGVVFTATLSSLQSIAKAETTKKPVSEWESVRRQLRNEKEEPKKPEASKPPTLSDVLLKVLAENGHHFSQLGENESLTLVLTVRETSSPYTDFLKSAKQPTKTGAASGKKEDASPHPSSEVPHSSNFVRDMEVLGDLHFKQGHYEDALKEYKKVVRIKPTVEAYRKLAQCYLALEKYGDARFAIERAIALTKEGADTKDKPTPSVKPSTALPVKLIISAPKKLLDQVKEGKITFEEFRAKAHVETLRFDESRPRK